MQKALTVKLSPGEINNTDSIKTKIAATLAVNPSAITGFHINKRSIDARSRNIVYVLSLKAFINEPFVERNFSNIELQDVSNAGKSVIIVGAGPAGLYAALKLIENGIKPVILERGKNVRDRRRDLAALNKEGIINSDSNYCFGEGGAGTYSDGKLYTRSNKRGDISRILSLFVQFGAEENILFDAHPHIGTNKLPKIITSMREAIISAGGEIHFDKRVTDINFNGKVVQCVLCGLEEFKANDYILATGHSARDIFHLLKNKNISIEAKPFALGVRVEHPQNLIDNIQYSCDLRPENLPPSSYSLVQQINGRGMFSFCMCPGGIIAPAGTSPAELVVNGWSPSKRNNPFANSGIVVEVDKENALKYLGKGFTSNDPLLFMHFQQKVEQDCFIAGGGKFVAPAQRLADFSKGKISAYLPETSYLPGVNSVNLKNCLPEFIYQALAAGFPLFGKKMKGYFTNDAVVVATESRTSSPVKIPRQRETYNHIDFDNLYPCGEGSGFAGGIVSAAMDGENVAAAIIAKYRNTLISRI